MIEDFHHHHHHHHHQWTLTFWTRNLFPIFCFREILFFRFSFLAWRNNFMIIEWNEMKFFTAKNHQYEINVWQNSNSFRFMTEKKIRYDHIDDDHILMDLTFDSSLGLYFLRLLFWNMVFSRHIILRKNQDIFLRRRNVFFRKKTYLKNMSMFDGWQSKFQF